jgi:DNA polymerase elongation subunit (family B)
VFSQLLRKARQRGYILPFKKGGGPGAGDGVAYEGATVLEPKIGAYTCAVLVPWQVYNTCLYTWRRSSVVGS